MTSGDRIVVSVSPGERRVAAIVGGRLHLVAIERPDLPDGVGDIHQGRVVAISGAMSGAFIELGDGETGFLPENETPPPRRPIAKAVSEGDMVLVQVTRAAQAGKGPRVTMNMAAPPTPPAVRKPLRLARGPSAALRFARLLPQAMVETDSPAASALLMKSLGRGRVRSLPGPAFDESLESEFADLLEVRFDLPGGARLLIHPTPALIAIDVDSGRTAGSADPASHSRINDAAAAEIVRQIRLRNLSGAILVDFAGLSISRRASVLPPLTEALAGDPLRPTLLGLTRLGLVEIVRRRVHPPLHEVVGRPPKPLSHLLSGLRRLTREAAARPHARLFLSAAPEVIDAAHEVPSAAEEYRAATGRPLALRRDATRRPGQEQIEEDHP